MAVSHAHMSGQQQGVIGYLFHGEPKVVQRFELLDVSLSATDCCFKVPFPQILKQTETESGGIAAWGGFTGTGTKSILRYKPTSCDRDP